MIKPAYSVSFLLSINIFVWQNVLYFLDAPLIYLLPKTFMVFLGPTHPSTQRVLEIIPWQYTVLYVKIATRLHLMPRRLKKFGDKTLLSRLSSLLVQRLFFYSLSKDCHMYKEQANCIWLPQVSAPFGCYSYKRVISE